MEFLNAILVSPIIEIYEYPLFQSAIDTINRQLKIGISDQDLTDLVLSLRGNGRLSMIERPREQNSYMRIICSMSLRSDV